MPTRRSSDLGLGGLPQEFWDRVELVGSCWIWTKTTNGVGYGFFSIKGKSLLTHRLAYEDLVGPLDPELVLDHLCRVTLCLNPDHVEQVTQEENERRGYSFFALRRRQTSCIHGHDFNKTNTYTKKNGTRACKACSRDRQRRYRNADK